MGNTRRPTVIHMTTGLAYGGTERLLVGVINAMPQYEHRIISLQHVNQFAGELDESIVTYLNLKGYASLPKLIAQVRAIVKPYKGNAMVHAHMFWANIISRFAVPRQMPLLNSYHSMAYGREGANYPLHAVLLDRFSYQRRVQTICVSGSVKENIARHIGIRQKVMVMQNYIEGHFYQEKAGTYQAGNCLRLVAVGNLKLAKNYDLAIEGLHELIKRGKGHACTLDIVGSGPLEGHLRQKAADLGVQNVRFLGLMTNVAEQLKQYDAYLMTSSNEGFGIALAEAMASGLPAIVSDLPVLHEVSGGHALFFNPSSPAELANRIEEVYEGKVDLAALSEAGSQVAQHYKKDHYLERLSAVYEACLHGLDSINAPSLTYPMAPPEWA